MEQAKLWETTLNQLNLSFCVRTVINCSINNGLDLEDTCRCCSNVNETNTPAKDLKKYIYHSDILGTFKTLPLAERTNSGNGPWKLL